MLDLDAFKAFNDSRGHPAGDALLVGDRARRWPTRPATATGCIATAATSSRRSCPAPTGSPPTTSPSGSGAAVAERPLETSGPHVTVSAGVACYPGRRPDQGRPGGRGRPRACTSPRRRPASTARRPASDDPYLRALDETALALLDRRDPAVLLETILTRACALLGTPHGYIHLAEPDGRGLEVRHGTGAVQPVRRPPTLDRRGSRRRGSCATGAAVRDRRLRHVRAAGRGSSRRRSLGAVVGVPLIAATRSSASSASPRGRAAAVPGPRDRRAVAFAQLASIVLDNARLVDDAQRGALYDPTTGLPNRELLTDRIAHALASASPDEADPIAVLMLDLDRFKVINESVGHAVGDRLLVAVGQRLVASLRPGDTVARFGGDEFGIILDHVADADEARQIADRIGRSCAPVPAQRPRLVRQRLDRASPSAGPAARRRTSCCARPRSRWSAPRPIRPAGTPCSSRR